MSIISYIDFLANAQAADIEALVVLASGTQVKTTDSAQADVYQAQCQRLFDAECIDRFARGLERANDAVIWHTFDGRVKPEAISYIQQMASERVILSRNPLP